MSIGRLLPRVVRNAVWRFREGRRLSALPSEACDATPLRRLDERWLRQVLSDPAIHAEWPAVAAEMEAFRITAAAGGVNPGDRRALYYLIRALRPARVLEIGTHIGASTAHLAAALRANAAAGGPPPFLTTVDIQDVNDPVTRPWEGFGSTFAPAEMVRQMGMAERVRFIASPSLTYLAQATDPFDLIFLDGDHSATTVYREIPAALRRLGSAGVLVLHDFYPGGRPLMPGETAILGPWLGLRRLQREGTRMDALPLGELDWPTRSGGRRTSLALAVATA